MAKYTKGTKVIFVKDYCPMFTTVARKGDEAVIVDVPIVSSEYTLSINGERYLVTEDHFVPA